MKLKLFCSLFLCMCIMISVTAQSTITKPEAYLGHKPGADYKLTTYEQWSEYMNILADESPRMAIGDMGETTEGRRMIYGIISSEANMERLDEFKATAKRLSLIDGVSPEEALKMAASGRAIVWISAGLHSTETAPPQHHFQLPYDVITGEDPTTKMIRDSVILILPIANPDGMTQVAEWYRQNVGTEYETSPLPTLYNKYAGHDNNRDTFIANLKETQNINRIVNSEWYLSLFYDQHTAAPFPARIWIPPGPEPTNPNKHPIIIRTKNLVGSAMGKGLEENDQTGAISRIAFDIWYPGYIDGPAIEGHNIPSILTETALYRYATPKTYTIDDFPEEYKELRMGVFYPSPWKGGTWRIGDAVAYNLTASKSLLETVALYKSDFLHNKYKMGTDVIKRFNEEGPHGWVVPKEQADKGTTALMLNRMMQNGVQVFEASAALAAGNDQINEGDYVLPTTQPFGLYVKNLMEYQDYPDLRKFPHLWQGISRMTKWDGAPFLPYDGVGWTLPSQMGIKTIELDKPLTEALAQLDAPISAGSLSGSSRSSIISASENNAYLAANLALQSGGTVSRTTETMDQDGQTFPVGSFLIKGGKLSGAALAENADVPVFAVASSPGSQKLKEKRIGLYDSWRANMDAGWIKLLLDQYGFEYSLLRNNDLQQAGLSKQFDVIIIPDQSLSQIMDGHKEGDMPPEYVGGLGEEGVAQLKAFVEAGGKLLLNKRASDIALEHFGLPVTNVLKDVKTADFTCPGSVLRVNYNATASTRGMSAEGIGYFAQGHAYEIEDSTGIEVVATYPNAPLLISGWLEGGELIQGKAAVIKASMGKGAVTLFGFNVQNRMQAYGTIKLMMNSLLND
ncbi:MAG: M14 family metallopeptidase [Cyclobacteriaceae bacterium]